MNNTPTSEEWVFTFGFGHIHPDTGASLANCYVVIEGDFNSSRRRMAERFGTKWSMQYKSRKDAGVDKYGLREIEL